MVDAAVWFSGLAVDADIPLAVQEDLCVFNIVVGSCDDVLLAMLDGGHSRRRVSEDRRDTRSWASTGSGSPCSLTILNVYLEKLVNA